MWRGSERVKQCNYNNNSVVKREYRQRIATSRNFHTLASFYGKSRWSEIYCNARGHSGLSRCIKGSNRGLCRRAVIEEISDRESARNYFRSRRRLKQTWACRFNFYGAPRWSINILSRWISRALDTAEQREGEKQRRRTREGKRNQRKTSLVRG